MPAGEQRLAVRWPLDLTDIARTSVKRLIEGARSKASSGRSGRGRRSVARRWPGRPRPGHDRRLEQQRAGPAPRGTHPPGRRPATTTSRKPGAALHSDQSRPASSAPSRKQPGRQRLVGRRAEPERFSRSARPVARLTPRSSAPPRPHRPAGDRASSQANGGGDIAAAPMHLAEAASSRQASRSTASRNVAGDPRRGQVHGCQMRPAPSATPLHPGRQTSSDRNGCALGPVGPRNADRPA